MQLANHPPETDKEISPYLRAALIDSLFETPGPLLTGLVFGAIAAAMTALKTEEPLIWACVALLIVAGAVRAFDLQRYQARKSTLTADEAARWKQRYQIGAMIQAAAVGIWCSTTLLVSDDAVAHMICLSVDHRDRGGRCRQGLWTAVDIPAAGCTRLRFNRDRAGVAWHALLHRHVGRVRRISCGRHANFGQSAQDIHAGAFGARARGGAGRPVRHRAEQHAARPVHVRPPTGALR